MGADVVQHPDVVGLKGHRIARHAKAEGNGGLVGQRFKVNRALEKLVRGHIVFNAEAEVYDASCHCGHPLMSGRLNRHAVACIRVSVTEDGRA